MIPREVHGDLARTTDFFFTTTPHEIVARNAKIRRYAMYDEVDVDELLRLLIEGLNEFLSECKADACLLSECGAVDALHTTFELADVCRHFRSDVLGNVVGKEYAFRSGFGAQNRQSRLEIGQLDIEPTIATEPRSHALVDIFNFVRVTVTRENDLFFVLDEIVERVEEFFLRTLFAGQELDIVDE